MSNFISLFFKCQLLIDQDHLQKKPFQIINNINVNKKLLFVVIIDELEKLKNIKIFYHYNLKLFIYYHFY